MSGVAKLLFYFVILFSCLTVNRANAIKIVAIVNDDIVTDVDVYDFERILCKLDKRFTCGSQDSLQVALMTLIDSILRLEHFKQMKILEDKNIRIGFNEYKNGVIKNIHNSNARTSKIFEDYLLSEYIWNIMMSSQAQTIRIQDNEIEEYKKHNNLLNKRNEEIKSLIFREKMNNIAQSTMSEIKKFYLVEIKGL